jgi:hypothetical protein
MSRDADELDFDREALFDASQFEAHRFVHDFEVARKERKSLVQVFRARRHVEEDAGVPRIGLLGEFEPENAIPHCLGCEFEEPALRCSEDALAGRLEGLFCQPCAPEQWLDVDIPAPEHGEGALDRKARHRRRSVVLRVFGRAHRLHVVGSLRCSVARRPKST